MDTKTTAAARLLTQAIEHISNLSQGQAIDLLSHLDAAFVSVVITGDEMPESQRVAGLDDLNLNQMDVINGARTYLGTAHSVEVMNYEELCDAAYPEATP